MVYVIQKILLPRKGIVMIHPDTVQEIGKYRRQQYMQEAEDVRLYKSIKKGDAGFSNYFSSFSRKLNDQIRTLDSQWTFLGLLSQQLR